MGLLDSLNLPVKSTEKLLETRKKLRTWGFVTIFQLDFEIHFWKISIFSFFLTHNLIDTFRALTLFYWRNDLSWRTFQTLWTNSQSPQKIYEKAFEKSHLKTWGRNETQNEVGIFWQNLMFWAAETLFFFKCPQKSFVDFTNILKVS